MRQYLTLGVLLFCVSVGAQTKYSKEIPVSTQMKLNLDFQFADEIQLEVWEEDHILVEVDVRINEGEDDAIFELNASSTADAISLNMNREKWEDYARTAKRKCWNTEINYHVYLPRSLEIQAETINGNYTLAYYGRPSRLKTISGDIVLTVTEQSDLDFLVKTISGEVYSNLEITYPDGKEGLQQVVGTNVKARVGSGGSVMIMESISGNIYLRKG